MGEDHESEAHASPVPADPGDEESDPLFAVSLSDDEAEMAEYLLNLWGRGTTATAGDIEEAVRRLADLGIDVRRLNATGEGRDLVLKLRGLCGLAIDLLDGPANPPGESVDPVSLEGVRRAGRELQWLIEHRQGAHDAGDTAAPTPRDVLKGRVVDMLRNDIPKARIAADLGCSLRWVQMIAAELRGQGRNRRKR